MHLHRHSLPQLSGLPFITDSGLETTLVFHDGLSLPCFASFPLLESDAGRKRLRDYFQIHIDIARRRNAGFLLEAPTWRANRDWGEKMGYSLAQLQAINRDAIYFLEQIRLSNPDVPMVISGNIGPRGDGYNPAFLMSAQEAQDYHAEQITTFTDTNADLVSGFTLCYAAEAIGITRAAQAADMPVVISFTVETDGKLITGQTLQDAIEEVDAATRSGPAYYMINCAHPTHFAHALQGERWLQRIVGVRANSSRKSHAELDASTELDDGNPQELGQEYRELKARLTNLSVYGGCCGTDQRHVDEIGKYCLA